MRDALEGYYSGKEEQVLNVATTIRVLIHDKPATGSRSLLSRLNPDYWDLTIYDKPPLSPKTVFAIRTPLVLTGGGASGIVRPTFVAPLYQQVSLRQWWTSDYQPLGAVWLSKEKIVLTVADKEGGTHIDDKLPDTHATLSEPPFRFGMDNGGQQLFIQPNMAHGITSQAGCELQECLERHFSFVK